VTHEAKVEDWPSLAEAMASLIEAEGYLHDGAVARAFRSTPRHVFVPAFYRTEVDGDGRVVTAGVVDASASEWLPTVYSNSVLITQVRPIEGQENAVGFTCSSSMPALMADMIEELGIKPGMRVLEIGTGTGYNAAILCHILGDKAVTTVDIDPELIAEAKDRLAGLGYHPSFDPRPGSYDRILVTHAVADIPAQWLRWSKPDGVILTDLRSPTNGNLGAWAKITVANDQTTAFGVLMSPRGFFMNARRVPEFADAGDSLPEFTEAQHQQRAALTETRQTEVPASVLDSDDFGMYLWRQSPELTWWEGEGTAAVNGPHGDSWAYVADGVVHHGGREDLWMSVERAYKTWDGAERPRMSTWLLKVDESGATTVELPLKRS
jgi:protein-L-isoaspartate O-methyltransferase